MVTGTDLTRPRTIEGITRPDPRNHYGQIISWVICWPWNLLWTFFVHNPFRYICQFALHEIHSTLDEIATGEFSEITRDMDERIQPALEPVHAPSTVQPAPQPTVAATAWQPPVDQGELSSLETVDEATFLAAAANRDEQAGVETLEESPAWNSMLINGDLPAGPHSAPTGNSDVPAPYQAPALPPTPEQDPWYAPGRARHDSGTPETN